MISLTHFSFCLCYYIMFWQRDESTSSRQAGMPPLVIPVSVPVRRNQVPVEQTGGWMREQRLPPETTQQSEHKLSVIVTRRRSLRASDNYNQVCCTVYHGKLLRVSQYHHLNNHEVQSHNSTVAKNRNTLII